jgi:hypothetical protein
MGYLRLYDYLSNIQSPVFNQLIQSNDALRVTKEAVSQALISSYITQKFDCAKEFKNTSVFSSTVNYNGNDLIELNYPNWVVQNYIVGQMVTYTDGNCYYCYLNTIANDLPTNTTYWHLLGKLHDLYYITLPYPEFNVYGFYNVNDIVFWKNKIYKNKVQTNIPSHIGDLQSVNYANIPLNNVFPDDPVNGVANWGTGVLYGVTGLAPNAALPTAWAPGAYVVGNRVLLNGQIWIAITNNSIKPGLDIINWQPQSWTFGDNRNPQIVEAMVWITIDKLAPLISPRNQPVFWDKKYNEFLLWLQMCADGIVTLGVPVIQPAQGARIRFVSKVKQNNGY